MRSATARISSVSELHTRTAAPRSARSKISSYMPAFAPTSTPRVAGSSAATETPGSGRKGKRVMNAESLRAMLALSPAQENERRAWQAYDSALEAARRILYDNAIELYNLKCRELDELKYV